MKTLSKFALAASILASTCAANAEWVNGYVRSSGTYVQPYYRTPANGVRYDNLSYRGYPSQQPNCVSRSNYGHDSRSNRPTSPHSYDNNNLDTTPRPYTGDCVPKPLFDHSRSSPLGL
jgi:hypothetical protein